MNLAVLISTSSAAAAIALGLVALVVSRAQSWRGLRWFAGVAFCSAAYAIGNVATSGGLDTTVVLPFSRFQTAAALAEAYCLLGFAQALTGGQPGRLERWLRLSLLGMAALALVPGLAYGGQVVERPFAPWGIAYRDAVPTPLGVAFYFLALAGAALVAVRIWRARRSIRHGRLITSAFVGLVVLGASDALGASGVVGTPYLLDVGFLLPVASLAYAGSMRFADDAEALVALRGRLEALVQERTLALTQALDALHQSEKLAGLGQFAAGVAHEVNNPASVVVANLRYLSETAAEVGMPGEARSAIAEALEAMQRINGLVRKLVDAGRLARSPAAGDRAFLLQVAQQVVDEASLRTGDRVAFSLQVSPADQVAVRAEVLQQILSSLLLNASDAIPPARHGRVVVRAGPGDDGLLRITVADDGQGMTEEVRRRAFEPFFSTKGEGRGAGLGLPVARALAESHGGSLLLESEPGRGTKAVLDLPEASRAGG
jgi:signal transduction histidine kinase